MGVGAGHGGGRLGVLDHHVHGATSRRGDHGHGLVLAGGVAVRGQEDGGRRLASGLDVATEVGEVDQEVQRLAGAVRDGEPVDSFDGGEAVLRDPIAGVADGGGEVALGPVLRAGVVVGDARVAVDLERRVVVAVQDRGDEGLELRVLGRAADAELERGDLLVRRPHQVVVGEGAVGVDQHRDGAVRRVVGERQGRRSLLGGRPADIRLAGGQQGGGEHGKDGPFHRELLCVRYPEVGQNSQNLCGLEGKEQVSVLAPKHPFVKGGEGFLPL